MQRITYTFHFLAHNNIYAEHAIRYLLSIPPSVARVDQSKTIKVNLESCNFHHNHATFTTE